MKNNLFKVCALGLITMVLFTGCNKKDGEVSKVKKNEEINYSRQSHLDDYYGIELFQYTNSHQTTVDFNDSKENFLQREEVVNVEALTKEDNMYEAIVTVDADYLVEKEYEYVLYIKNDNDYIVLFQTSNNKDKDKIKELGNKIKEKFSKSSDYKKVYDKFVKENELYTSHSYGCNGITSCKTSLVSTNIKVKDYKETDKKVKTVALNLYQVSPSTFFAVIEALTDSDELVWSKEYDTVPNGIDFFGVIAEQAGDYFYINKGEGKVAALDIQSGKEVWVSSIHESISHALISVNGKVFDIQGDVSQAVEVKSEKDGKTLYYEDDLIKYVTKENADNTYSILTKDAKVQNGYIVYEVSKYDSVLNKELKIGKLKINVNTYAVTFESNDKISNTNTKNEKTSNTSTSKVTKVTTKQTKEDNNYVTTAIATDANGNKVWSKVLGYIPEGSDNNSLIFIEGKDYVYINETVDRTEYFTALDKQTGKKVWQVKPKDGTITVPTIVEESDKLYVTSGMAGSYSLEVFDLKTGKELKTISNLENYVIKEDNRFDFEVYYDLITSTMKYNNGQLVFEVRDRDDYGHDTGVVGQLKVNISNYKIVFDRK